MAGSVCVYCSSSRHVAPEFFDLARTLGRGIAERGHSLIFGGANAGLMGAVAQSAKEAGGRVIGVIPKVLDEAGISFRECDELFVSNNLRERKALLHDHSDAYLAMPGGFGTLDEVFDALCLRLLKEHAKPLVFLNHGGFYDPLFSFFENLYSAKFAKEEVRRIYSAAPDVPAALDTVEKCWQGEPLENTLLVWG